jgi:hypothetical protein
MIYDIFELVAKYLTVEETTSLLLINKASYMLYIHNKNYCDRQFIEKILSFFCVNFDDKVNNIHNRSKNVKVLLKIYWHFRHIQNLSYLVDFIIYMIDNDIHDIDIFRLFTSNCKFVEFDTNYDIRIVNNRTNTNRRQDTLNFRRQRSTINLDDMMYIILHGCYEFLDIILNMFTIPVMLISRVIYKMLTKNVSRKVNNATLFKLTKYLFKKHCCGMFLERDMIYIHSIITMLIRYKKTTILKYFLDKKTKYIKTSSGLDYQYLVNKCIEFEDRRHLTMLLKANEFDNSRFIKKSFVIINTHHIIELCKNARFDYLSYLVENCLGTSINTGLYIDSICQGIELLILSKRSNLLVRFEPIKRYITSENLTNINICINQIYDGFNTLIERRIFI